MTKEIKKIQLKTDEQYRMANHFLLDYALNNDFYAIIEKGSFSCGTGKGLEIYAKPDMKEIFIESENSLESNDLEKKLSNFLNEEYKYSVSFKHK